ncbi:MAG: hypothetical protein ACPGR2_10895 [Psychrobium sp.]
MNPMRLFIIIFCAIGLMGCIVKPNFESSYNRDCNITQKRVTLSVEQVAEFGARDCEGEHACKAAIVTQVVTAGIALPVSAIISGSIALVGNTLYWLQEENCQS